jgi:hypothetical protein
MTELIKALFAVLISLTPYYTDEQHETDAEREARMKTIARAIADVSSRATCHHQYNEKACPGIWDGEPEQIAALLITQGYFESRFSYHVQAGKCLDHECDPFTKHDGTIIHLARSSWQLHNTKYTRKWWNKMEGIGFKPTWYSAASAAKLLSDSRKSCGTIRGAISKYATGRSCGWKHASKRINLYHNILAKIEQELN